MILYHIYIYAYIYTRRDNKNGIKYIKNYNKDFFIIELKTNEKFYIGKKMVYKDITVIADTFFNNFYNDKNIISGIKDKIVVDVGANIGDTAVFFAKHGGVVYAYEPSFELYEAAIKNASLNKLRINFINAGLGSENKKFKLSISKDGATQASKTIFDDNEVFQEETLYLNQYYNYGFEEVQIINFSDILKQFQSVYLVKLDCEGCEFEIFKCIDSDDLNKVEHFIIEYHFKEPDEIVNLLEENGFNVKINKGRIGFIWADKIQT